MSPDIDWKTAMNGGPEAVRTLIQQGADVNAKSVDSVRGGCFYRMFHQLMDLFFDVPFFGPSTVCLVLLGLM